MKECRVQHEGVVFTARTVAFVAVPIQLATFDHAFAALQLLVIR